MRQKSAHEAIGLRVVRAAAMAPTISHSITLSVTPIGYTESLENGAPTASRPGAANTPSSRPPYPLVLPSNTFNSSSESTPRIAGGTRARNGPRVRMRERYQRGPS